LLWPPEKLIILELPSNNGKINVMITMLEILIFSQPRH
jgi:hypothetical protein